MSTTTVRLPEALKSRIARVAEARGLTPHGFILEAIEAQTEQAEADAELHRVALQRWRRFESSGKAIPLEEARAYILALAEGKRPVRPKARRVSGRTKA